MELRHLRYFAAVVRANGYREASRQLHIAQPAISQTVAALEAELGIKLFARVRRAVRLTPEGEVFYGEAVRTLAQAEQAVETAKRAAKGEIGRLAIGFLGSATSTFLPELIRKYKSMYPGVKLSLYELTPVQQDAAFDQGTIDIGFTRTPSSERSRLLAMRSLYSDPIIAALPRSRRVTARRLTVADLAKESFILFHREGSPSLFDTITGLCNQAGFCPRIEHQPNMMQTVLSLVEAEQGVALVPACVQNLRSRGIQFYGLQPDDVRVDLVAVWKKHQLSVVLNTFLELLDANASWIRKRTRGD
jgi:DNA-binding transcriptional LysR family regulator